MSTRSAGEYRAPNRSGQTGMIRSGGGAVQSSALVATREHHHTMATPAHLAPRNCFVCGAVPHADTDHTFWSNAAALAAAREEDRRTARHYPVGETSPASAYVAERRPY